MTRHRDKRRKPLVLWSVIGILVVLAAATAGFFALVQNQPTSEPVDAEGYTRQADDRLERGDTAGAEIYYRRALKLDSTNAGACYGLAVIGYAVGKYKPAARLLRQAIQQDPGNSRAAYQLGLTFDRLQEPDSAIAYLRRSVELDSTFARASYSLGLLFFNQQEPDSAVKYLNRYLASGAVDEVSASEVRQLLEGIRSEH